MLAWRPRTDAPAPAGLVASGAVISAVLQALARREAAALQALSVVATRDRLVLLGPAAQLPWADGVAYCAPAADAPGLWLPTRFAPMVPPDLAYAALQRRTRQSAMLLWPDPDLVLGLDGVLPLQASTLARLARELA